MDPWNSNGGGGGFLNDTGTPIQSSKSGPRQSFLCPVTVGQVLEASEEGVKVGTRSATMLSLLGIVSCIETTSTNIKFSLSDDTGVIDCIEWLESEDSGESESTLNLMENSYYHVYGSIKSSQGHQKVMVFKTVLVTDFNEVTAFMLEVMNVNNYLEKEANKIPKQSTVGFTSDNGSFGSFGTSADEPNQTYFTPVQKAVLDAIKDVGTEVGWSKYDPNIKRKFSSKQIQDALDFLVGEGHIYTTVDDDHFCST